MTNINKFRSDIYTYTVARGINSYTYIHRGSFAANEIKGRAQPRYYFIFELCEREKKDTRTVG